MGKRKKRKKRQELYFGLAVLVLVFIVTGLTRGLEGGSDRSVETAAPAAEKEKAASGKNAENIEKTESGENTENAAEQGDENGKQDKDRDEKQGQDDGKKQKEAVKNPNIRVLLMSNGFSSTVHPEVKLSASSGMTVSYGDKKKEYKKDETLTIEPDHKWFQEGKIRVRAKKGKIKVESLKRGDGTPSYAGVIELRATAEGIAMINELPLESYLCGVVPSEMPASYEPEALKAQAVCARSYAYRQMEEYAYKEYKAHVNDSTDYQVYNNSEQAERSSKAVKDTAGETVRYKGKVVSTYYYSTSCGKTTNMEAWGTEPNGENGYLKSVEVKGKNGDYEKDLPWYRWTVKMSVGTLSDLIGLNTGKDVGTVRKVEITERGPGGVALEMKVTGKKGSVTVKTENKIRSALGGSSYEIEKQDGSRTEGRDILPSAFFTIKKDGDQFVIRGGGFGHGIGMSQTGANEMAKQGKNYKEILSLFYSGITVG